MRKILLALGAVSLSSSLAFAHHSGAMYNDEVMIETEATVVALEWTNPHSWIQVSYENEAGETIEADLELGSPVQLAGQGWRPRIVAPGDAVTIRFHPHREVAGSGILRTIELPDGSSLTSN
jgi:hypothetical protein